MLRSSREGRKQAARFHAFPSSRSTPRLATSSYPGQRENDKGALRAVSANHQSAEDQQMRAERSPGYYPHRPSVSAEDDPYASSSKEKQAEEMIATAGHDAVVFQETVIPAVHVENDGADVARSSSGDSFTSDRKPGNLTLFAESTVSANALAIEESRAIFAFQSLKEKTPSRGTTEDQSQTSSVLSSPPTSHPDDEGDISVPDYYMKHWQIDSREFVDDDSNDNSGKAAAPNAGDVSSKSSLDDTSMQETALDEAHDQYRQRPRYKRLQPRKIEGASLLDNRSRRVKVKSIKMVEAEESMALSPKRSKRARSDAMETSSNNSPVRSKASQMDDSAIEIDLFSGDSLLSRDSLRSTSFDNKGKGRQMEEEEHRSFNTSLMSTNGGLYSNGAGSIEQPEPVLVKRGRGRPKGSTKQKRLERLAEQRRLKLLQRLEAGLGGPTSDSGEDTEMNDPRDKTTASSVTRQSRRLTEPGQTLDAASVRQNRGRSSLPDMSRKAKSAGEERNSEERSGDEIIVEIVSKRNYRKRNAPSGGSREARDGLVLSDKLDIEAGEKSDKPVKALWKRKVFLSSGLYSNDYKNEEVARKAPRRSVREVSETLVRGTPRTRKANAVSALPLPCDYGHWLLVEKKDFRLPYPVAQEIGDIRAKLETKKKPPPYKRISQNRYFSRPKLPGEILICQCLPSGDCGDSCVNRQTEYLCHPKHCPCGERCTNIYFGKRKAVETEVQWYGARGFGLKTLENVPKGGFIDEYRGEVIDFNEAVRRIRDHYKETGNYYFLMYDAPAGEMLDGGLKGNITRFANHSCDPNCNVQKWLVCGTDEARSGEFQVALFAERDIMAGEELTYDYGWSAFAAKAVSGESSTAAPEECHCGAANCSGFLGVKKSAATTAAAGPVVANKVVKRSRKSKKVKAIRIRAPVASATHTGRTSTSKNFNDVKDSINVSNDPQIDISDNKSPHRSATADISMSDNLTASAVAAVTAALRTPTKAARPSQILSIQDAGISSYASPSESMSTLTSLSDEEARSELETSVEEPYYRRFGKLPFTSRVKMLKRTRDIFSEDSSMSSSVDGGSRSSPTTITAKSSAAPSPSPLHLDRQKQTDVEVVSTAPKRRLTVKDRVFTVLVPREKRGEREKVNLVVEGKRERKLSLKASESGEAGVPSFASPRDARTS